MQGITIIEGRKDFGYMWVKFERKNGYEYADVTGFELLLDAGKSKLTKLPDIVLWRGEFASVLSALTDELAKTWDKPVSAADFITYASGWLDGYELAQKRRAAAHVSDSMHQATPVT